MIAFDIATVAQKVKVQCFYRGPVCSEKVGWVGWCVSSRSGWLFELLTELKMAIILPTGQWYAPSAVINDAWYCMVLQGIAGYCMVLQGIAWYCMVLHGIA